MTSLPDQPRSATIQIPAPAGDGTKHSIPCTFSQMQGKRLILEASEAVAVRSAVSVEYEDSLFLGEVVTCAASHSGWHVEIKVEQILSGLQSLMALRAHLLSESVPKPLTLIPLGALN